jgi:hypothetical protein
MSAYVCGIGIVTLLHLNQSLAGMTAKKSYNDDYLTKVSLAKCVPVVPFYLNPAHLSVQNLVCDVTNM